MCLEEGIEPNNDLEEEDKKKQKRGEENCNFEHKY